MLKNSITNRRVMPYYRVSGKSQAEGLSLDEQNKLCKEFAEEHLLKALLSECEGEDE